MGPGVSRLQVQGEQLEHVNQTETEGYCFLDPTGSLTFVGWLVSWLVTILLNCKLIDLKTY